MPKDDPAKDKGNNADPKDSLVHDDELDDDPEGDEPEGDEPEGDDTDDSLSLDELDAALRKAIDEEVGGADRDDDDDEDDEEPESGKGKKGDESAIEARLKKLEAENRALKKQKLKESIFAERKAAAMEMRQAARKLRMTKQQVDRAVLWYKRNPDLEGVVPFEEGALRANPSLAGSDRTPGPGHRNGARREEGAEVVTRGGNGQGARREPFKPGPAKPGNYDNVTQFIRRSGAMGKLLRVTDD